jgi:peptidoglycan lytic transglycosylase
MSFGCTVVSYNAETEFFVKSIASARFRNFARFAPVAIATIALAGCNQYTTAGDKSGLHNSRRQAALVNNVEPTVGTVRHVAARRVRHTPFKRPIETQFASHGIASFYSDEQQTANGEKFNPRALTAAHKSLPFGTRLRVTNVATGRSVTVRINDRGPYVRGRVVDVSYSAAESLGIVGKGIAKVKLDVIN